MPITPEEVEKGKHIPDWVYNVFDTLIAEKYNEGRAQLLLSEVTDRLLAVVSVNGNRTRADIHSSGWLNVENAYRKVGWDVEFHQPDISENFNPYYLFKKKRT